MRGRRMLSARHFCRKRQRTGALQDAGARFGGPSQWRSFWSAPALWRFGAVIGKRSLCPPPLPRRLRLFRDGSGDPERQAIADLAQSVSGLTTDQRIAVVHREEQGGNW